MTTDNARKSAAWHSMTAEEVMRKLGTSRAGLSRAEAEARAASYGPNALPASEGPGPLKIFLSQFSNPLNWVLLGAAALSFSMKEVADGSVIIFIVMINAVIGFYQEYKAERSVRALQSMVVSSTRVVRGGAEYEIPSSQLVPGDIIILASGARVPADGRLAESSEFKADEAMLTGESLPAEKSAASIADAKAGLGDRPGSVFMGTAVVSGRAVAVVTATGSSTEIGNIAGLMKETESSATPLQKRFEKLSKVIGLGTLGASAVLFAAGLARGESLQNMLMTVIAVAVATIPEGLPIVVTIAMSIGVSRMARRHVIIRKLPAVETLGSTTVICTDKTGTLTRNEMTVRKIYDGRDLYDLTGTGYSPEGELDCGVKPCSAEQRGRLEATLACGVLCNESSVYLKDGAWKVSGDPTEAALIVAAKKAGLDPDQLNAERPRLDLLPFESEHGYMASLNGGPGGPEAFVKGAPEFVAEMCSFSPEEKESVLGAARTLAASGMRVLMTASKPWKEPRLSRKGLSGLAFSGLQGMIDPPRAEAVEAIGSCAKAGIRAVMITGDHALTAGAIGREIGIGGGSGRVITGRELAGMTDEQLYEAVKDVSVYARVAPEHKLRIVTQLMKRGEIVAVTGDGVNDAPALKAAHIGAAMGITGTDVAKEAADMVVTDDNFASVYNAVVEGRIVFDNIRKAVFFLLPTGLSAVLAIAGTMLLGLPIPFTAMQLLWINIVTNSLQDLAMAFEPEEPSVRGRPPMNPAEGILSRTLLQRTVLVGLLIAVGVLYNFKQALVYGYSLEEARTVAMTTMVFFQFFQTWNARSETQSVFRISPLSNPLLAFSMLGALIAQILVIYEPRFGRFFHTVPLRESEWIGIILTALSVVALVEADKFLRNRAAGRKA